MPSRQLNVRAGNRTLQIDCPQGGSVAIERCEGGEPLQLAQAAHGEPRYTLRSTLRTVSTSHGRVWLDENAQAFYEDLGSTNGSFLRLPARQPIALAAGSELLLGRELGLSLDPSPGALSLDIHAENSQQLVAQIRTILANYVADVRVEEQRCQVPESEDVYTVPILPHTQRLVIEWKGGTFNIEAGKWVRDVVSIYNSQLQRIHMENWRFCAASPARVDALALAQRVAYSDCGVLIVGSNGTGKDVLAQDIHHHSPRSAAPFVAINCSAVPDGLFESELFGHIKGSFTNAFENRLGLIECAAGGTLFLDEIGDLPVAQQAKLLRVLEEKRIRPLGGRKDRAIDVRIIAATNKNLAAMVTSGTFREDLFHRLSTVQIVIPPLLPADVSLLARSLITELAGSEYTQLTRPELEEVVRLAASETWTGGARELRSALLRYLMLKSARLSVLANWQEAQRAGAKLYANSATKPTPLALSHRGVPDPLTAIGLLERRFFLATLRDILRRNPRSGVSHIAAALHRTRQAVYGRLQSLELKLGGPTDIQQLDERLAELDEQILPLREWLDQQLFG